MELITDEDRKRLVDWQVRDLKGTPVRRASSALKLLEEVAELCYAAGAMTGEIDEVIADVQNKSIERHEDDGIFKIADVISETGDVVACLTMFTHYCRINPADTVSATLERIDGRQWHPDQFGILRRPK